MPHALASTTTVECGKYTPIADMEKETLLKLALPVSIALLGLGLISISFVQVEKARLEYKNQQDERNMHIITGGFYKR